MFTGLIKEVAKSRVNGNKIFIKADYKPGIGDSIAINGACLSVVKIYNDGFEVDISHESKSVIALENYNGNVNIEPAMRLNDRVEGHILQGHIDCKGIVQKIEKVGNNYDLFIKLPKDYMKFVIPKGSIGVDGVSLTINEVFEDYFRLTIIPVTVQNSIIREYKTGRSVNIETDMFARYIYHMFKKDKDKINWSDIDKVMALW